MNKKGLVSVVIAAYNAQDFISETIRSILEQTYPSIEIIVVDDGSTDRTGEIVRSFGGSVFYFHQPNSGGGATPRNTGLLHCSGDYVSFIDADDLMPPGRTDAMISFLERHPGVDLVFSDYRNFNEQGHFPETHFQKSPIFYNLLNNQEEIVLQNACMHLARENFGSCGSFMFRKKLLYIESGCGPSLFDPSLKACEDFHFYYRLARHTEVGIINSVGMLRRLHGKNMTHNGERMLLQGIKSRSLLSATENDPEAKAFLNEYISSCWSALSRHSADQGQHLYSLQCELNALTNSLSPKQIKSSLKNFARTLAMASGIHKR